MSLASGTVSPPSAAARRHYSIARLVPPLRALAVYTAALTALVLAVTTLRDRSLALVPPAYEWCIYVVAALPLVAALASEAVPAWLRRRREQRLIQVVM